MKVLLLLTVLIASRDIAGVVPVCRDGSLLLVSNRKNHYVFPKGGVKKERGEGPLQAALREAHEEAGIRDCTASGPPITARNTTYFVVRVRSVDRVFKESAWRRRLRIRPEDALEHRQIPEYIKEIIRMVSAAPLD